LDWEETSSDKTLGLDGTSVRIASGKQSAKVWSPDYDSKKRGLIQFQKLAEALFDLAQLDRTGMSGLPQQKNPTRAATTSP